MGSSDLISLMLQSKADPTSTSNGFDSEKTSLAVTDGGTFAADTKFESGKLATPIKEGSIFDGWYENEGCTGTAVTNSTLGKTYYAKWIELKSDAISMEYGSTQTLPTIEGVTLSNCGPVTAPLSLLRTIGSRQTRWVKPPSPPQPERRLAAQGR